MNSRLNHKIYQELGTLKNKYTEDIAVDGRLIQKELGFMPQYALSAGWSETVQEMRRMGEL